MIKLSAFVLATVGFQQDILSTIPNAEIQEIDSKNLPPIHLRFSFPTSF